MTEARSKVIQGETSSPASDDSWDSLLMAMEERLTKRIEQTMMEKLEGFRASQQLAQDRQVPFFGGDDDDQLSGGGGIAFPRFGGTKVKDWLFKVDEFFAIVDTPIESKVKFCGKHFDGNAAKWHQTMMQSPYGKNLLNDWGFYKQLLKERFKDTGDDPIAELKTLQETEDIVDYHKKFEKIRMRVNLPEEYLVSVYLTGLRLDTQMHVRRFRPHCIRRCFELGQLYEMAYPIKGTGSVKNFPESQKWSKPEKSKGIKNKSEVEEVLIVQGDITVESDSVLEQIKDVSVPFSGEERVCAAESSIQVVDETYAVPDEEINPREPLLLDNSQEEMKLIQALERYDVVHKDEAIESKVKIGAIPQSQVYRSVRRDASDQCLMILGIEKMKEMAQAVKITVCDSYGATTQIKTLLGGAMFNSSVKETNQTKRRDWQNDLMLIHVGLNHEPIDGDKQEVQLVHLSAGNVEILELQKYGCHVWDPGGFKLQEVSFKMKCYRV